MVLVDDSTEGTDMSELARIEECQQPVSDGGSTAGAAGSYSVAFLTGRDSLGTVSIVDMLKPGVLNPNLGRLNSGCLEGLATNRCEQRSEEIPCFDVRACVGWL
ncbi:hypothetical protein BASA83_012322 [Batrachochytrium salamandrivorans]|nr:hypothetical protein BASA83_012322 [Batrachochytrium salamandrivorans]